MGSNNDIGSNSSLMNKIGSRLTGMWTTTDLYDRLLIFGSLIVWAVAGYLQSRELLIVCGVLLLALNVKCCIKDIKNHFIYLGFLFGIFLFLMGKPIIRIGNLNSMPSSDYLYLSKTMTCIIISLLFLYLGERYYSSCETHREIRVKLTPDMHILRMVAAVVIGVSFIGVLASSIDKLLFMQNHSYVEYYSSYVTTLPRAILMLQHPFIPAVFLYLATFPKKSHSYVVLGMYIFSNAVSFIVGMRSPLLLSIVFSVLYLAIRHYWIDKNMKALISKKVAVLLVILLPIVSGGLMAYNYIRQDIDIPMDKLLNPVVSFVDQQGQTFIGLCQGYDNIDKIKENKFPGYTFGPAYDIVANNVISRKLFGTADLAGQGPNAINYGHDMKAHLSYAVYGQGYYAGYGVGSSYIFELYYDFGYIGIAVFSFILGYLMLRMKDFVSSKALVPTVITLFAVSELMYVPRSNAALVFKYFFNIYYWITYIGIFILYKLVKKFNDKKKGETDGASTAE